MVTRVQQSPRYSAHWVETLSVTTSGSVLFGDDVGILGRWSLSDNALTEVEVEGFETGLSVVLEYTPDELLVGGRNGLALIGTDGQIRRRLEQSGPVFIAAWAGPERLLIASADEQLRLLHTETGATLDEIWAGERTSGIEAIPGTRSYAVTTSCQGGSRLFWIDVVDDRIRIGDRPELQWVGDHLSAPGIDVRGRYVGCASHRFEIFETSTGRRRARIEPSGRAVWGPFAFADGPLVEKSWSRAMACGSGLACSSPKGTIYWVDPAGNGRPVALADIEGGATNIGGDGKGRLVAAGRDGRLHLF